MQTSGTKNKAVSFNIGDPIEKSMYDFACNMKRNKQSFSGLLKNLLLIYMANTGNAPPGLQGNIMNVTPSMFKQQNDDIPKFEISKTQKDMIAKMPYSDDD